jgi:S1-C subfamily serine protease
MSAYEPNDRREGADSIQPDREVRWSPEPDATEVEVAAAAWQAPAVPPPADAWQAPAVPPPADAWQAQSALQPPAPAQPWAPPPPPEWQASQPWAAAPYLPAAPVPAAPAQSGGRRRTVPLILATALLSATLSAAGTYVAFSVAPRTTTSVAPAQAGQSPSAQLVSLTQSQAIVRVVNLVQPSVVTITTAGMSGLSPFSVPTTGAGSGFIVSSDGLILTNNHVVMDSKSLTVTLDDSRELAATVVATDPTHDLALIKVTATGLTPVTLGDSGAIQVGQLAIAIGSPLGTFTDSVTQGIVSGLNRDISIGDRTSQFSEDLKGLIQTDAAINPGNSGGPLLDVNGSVVGIITASASSAQDMGFAIPINQAKVMIAKAASGV